MEICNWLQRSDLNRQFLAYKTNELPLLYSAIYTKLTDLLLCVKLYKYLSVTIVGSADKEIERLVCCLPTCYSLYSITVECDICDNLYIGFIIFMNISITNLFNTIFRASYNTCNILPIFSINKSQYKDLTC